MNYSCWTLKGGAILLEKYEGNVTKEVIIENDNNLFQMADPNCGNILLISDITDAKLDDIDFGELVELFKSIELHSKKTKGMKLAIYSGDNSIDDFLKASSYSKYEDKFNLSINCFETIDEIFEWMKISEKEQTEIRDLLNIN